LIKLAFLIYIPVHVTVQGRITHEPRSNFAHYWPYFASRNVTKNGQNLAKNHGLMSYKSLALPENWCIGIWFYGVIVLFFELMDVENIPSSWAQELIIYHHIWPTSPRIYGLRWGKFSKKYTIQWSHVSCNLKKIKIIWFTWYRKSYGHFPYCIILIVQLCNTMNIYYYRMLTIRNHDWKIKNCKKC